MGRSSKAATANAATSKGSATPAFWHIAYIRAVLISCLLNSSSLAFSLFALSTIRLLSYDRQPIWKLRRQQTHEPPRKKLEPLPRPGGNECFRTSFCPSYKEPSRRLWTRGHVSGSKRTPVSSNPDKDRRDCYRLV